MNLDPEKILARIDQLIGQQSEIGTRLAQLEASFKAIEAALEAKGKQPADSDLAEMDALWNAAKAAEKAARRRPE